MAERVDLDSLHPLIPSKSFYISREAHKTHKRMSQVHGGYMEDSIES